MTDDEEKLYEAYYEPDHLLTCTKAIKELHKMTAMSKKDIKSLLDKQALWQVHIPPPKKINHPHCDVTKPNEQHQFDLVHIPRNFFEGNIYRYFLSGVDVASIYRAARPLPPKNQRRLYLYWEQSIRNVARSNIRRFSKLITVLSSKAKSQS